jgi:hypothetical protein
MRPSGGLGVRRGQFALGDAGLEHAAHALQALLHAGLVDIVEHDRVAEPGGLPGDAVTHGAGAEDGDALDLQAHAGFSPGERAGGAILATSSIGLKRQEHKMTRADHFGDPEKRRVQYEKRGPVALLTLEDDDLNGYTFRMFRDLDDCILQARFDPEVQTIVITGAGEHFCAGANIKMLEQADPRASTTSACTPTRRSRASSRRRSS